MRKGADDDRDAHHRPRHNRKDSIPSFPARLPHLKSPDAATAVARFSHRPSSARTASRRLFSRNISFKGKAMAAVHYYLGRPARVWISAHSRRSPARQARTGSGGVHSGIPGQPASGFTPSVPAAAHGSSDAYSRRVGHRKSSVTATSGLPPDPAPAGGLLARHRTAIARFGTDVAARRRHRPGPGRRTGPGRLPGRARRRTPGLGTRPGLPGAMRAVPGAVPGPGGRIAPPDGNGTGMQPALIAPSSADQPPDRHPHRLHSTHSGTAQRSNAYSPPVARILVR